MARACPSCGGIVGRDCFNPMECAIITHREEARFRQTVEINGMTLSMLQDKFFKLLRVLEVHGIDVSEVMQEPESTPFVVDSPFHENDSLPF